ncbi:hypothetical protein D3C79_563650 [compost metagenome]
MLKVVFKILAVSIVGVLHEPSGGGDYPTAVRIVNKQTVQLRQIADLPLHQLLQPQLLRLAQPVDLNAFGQIRQRVVHLQESVIGMLRQRACQIGGLIFGAFQIALMRIPDLPDVKQNQRGGNDDDKHASLK